MAKKLKKKTRPRSVSLVVRDPGHRLPQPLDRDVPLGLANILPAALSSDPIITAAFIGTLTLTEAQISALRRPVADAEVEWKPAEKDGPPVIPYLSHNGYRDRLDAAFGLGGWGMVPTGQPKEVGQAVFVPYALVIGGLPRVYAWGEQQIHKMTYGDALEGAKSNAIVRCGKELGIGRELWNRGYITGLKQRLANAQAARHAHGGRNEILDDLPMKAGTDATVRTPLPTVAYADEPITEPQMKRLWAIVKTIGRPTTEVAMWLTAAYGVTDSRKIQRKDYATIIKAIETRGPLPMPED
jgi:hypothetical protein